MFQKFIVTGIFIFSITAFSFFIKKTPTPHEAVKLFYLQQAKQFENEIIILQKLVATGNEKQLQQQFLKVRSAYKQMEAIVEYYFNFFAVKLNGPPIPFFEEDESDVGQQQPAGMQVIEGMIFPVFNKASKTALNEAIGILLLDNRIMQETNESNAFNEELIFDAVTEELYRITSMGITDFDSQAAINGLSECGSAIAGLQNILLLYEQEIKQATGDKNKLLQNLLNSARNYLNQNTDFNAFNRMRFITEYLNPHYRNSGGV